ncbi:lytic transglycosylase domain-containing protein [Aliarcobacter skirrowii]|uniref:Lytic murein transglycosylase n=4 Tax=Aliarcobacter skirrowii TaxID=28200 RepID=A0AAD0SLA3_9BACT|nr:lytic transglycosylase domain-containing protein [Aliarcobacter skirrowii]AXX84846.1 soluble lytic murein transglycosylase [Aliarcobacter skirrowii CCUG 10374]KAB0620423.1 transglycosylase SLT domain-containing protein [Aliarcobacter skirrowii CCUG 10374]MDD2508809.1 transglycosylase SLT domain-containing protein [Aliarcobacter skirrowii]MDD3497345.1 transglycosylase SLT domain-containing protein [Aliarcobacter skirrowii]RXI25614.1 lytic murein transglycosylase [Aliarcobacter skirrowii CCUG
MSIVFKIFLVFALFSSLFSADFMEKDFKVTLEWLENKPKSNERDFFIVQFLNYDTTTKEEAQKAYDLRRGYNASLEKLYNQKFAQELNEEEKFCKNADFKTLIKQDSSCIQTALDSVNKLFKLSKKELHYLIPKVKDENLKENLQILASKNIFKELSVNKHNKFIEFFFATNGQDRLKYFNRKLTKELLENIVLDRDFDKFLRVVIFNNEYKNIQKSLYILNQNQNLTAYNSFLLGINEVNHNNSKLANNFFKISYKKSFLRSQKDNALFWLYLTSDDKNYLEELANSYDTNLYSLYAKEILNKYPTNIIYSLDTNKNSSSFNIYDSFAWFDINNDVRSELNEEKLAKYYDILDTKETKTHLAYILERYDNFKTQYFLTPYRDIIKEQGIFKELLIYAIARQESRFIPSAISVAGAQGIMQIMPFLSEDIARRLKEPYNIYEQFIPEKNLKYASFHLDNLIKQFDSNPLFVAYAYNGGAGYTKNQLKKGLFTKTNKYEPFLSMEMISYQETKEYGKRVLANFYIYNNYLNSENKISLSTIFQNLKQPQ